MSGGGDGDMVELKLNFPVAEPRRSVSPTSPLSSCVSSEPDEYSGSGSRQPEVKPMILVGCPMCLMYVMLSEEQPRCPKCKTTVLLHLIHHKTAAVKLRILSEES